MQTITTRIVGITTVAIIAAFIGATNLSRGLGTTEAVVSSAPADEQAGGPTRDQPGIRSLFWWNGRIVAHTVGSFQVAGAFYWIDPRAAKATPVFAPGDRKLIHVASGAEGESLALGQEQRNRFVIFAGRGE
ncbi:MAG TPA: hypothetical protein VN920_13065, partial [Pyrinomonadaceae bacterium]|nr:hypothetical protein [Pyrinomonadaceae bacterium]